MAMNDSNENDPGRPSDGNRDGGRDDDRRPQSGNPGGAQVENMPGQGAKRGDQGTTGGEGGRNPGPGKGRQH
jgi:hypothetical protein